MGITEPVQVMNIVTDESGKLEVSDESISSVVDIISGLVYKLQPSIDEIISQLKIMNIHLSMINDQTISIEEMD